MKKRPNPSTAHTSSGQRGAQTTSRSSAQVRGRSTQFIANPCRWPQRTCPETRLHFCHSPAVSIEKTEIRRFYREDWDPALCTSWYLRVENFCAAAIFKKTCFARRKIGIWHKREEGGKKNLFCFYFIVAGKTREFSSQVDSKLGPKMHPSAKS